MSSLILWYLLAGFVLGFAVSTLWEWLYYRGVRQRTLANMAAVTPPVLPARSTTQPVDGTPRPGQTEYRSPAIFIEGERSAEALNQAEPIPSYEPLTPRKPVDETAAPSPTQERKRNDAVDVEVDVAVDDESGNEEDAPSANEPKRTANDANEANAS